MVERTCFYSVFSSFLFLWTFGAQSYQLEDVSHLHINKRLRWALIAHLKTCGQMIKKLIKSISTCISEKFGQGFPSCNRLNRIFHDLQNAKNVLIWFLSSPFTPEFQVTQIYQISLKSEKLKKSVKNWRPFSKWLSNFTDF